MSYYLQQGIGMFISMKMLLCILPLFLVEYARKYRPRLARFGLRAVISGYLLTYLGGVAFLNSDFLQQLSDTKTGPASAFFKNINLPKIEQMASNRGF